MYAPNAATNFSIHDTCRDVDGRKDDTAVQCSAVQYRQSSPVGLGGLLMANDTVQVGLQSRGAALHKALGLPGVGFTACQRCYEGSFGSKHAAVQQLEQGLPQVGRQRLCVAHNLQVAWDWRLT